MKTTFIRHDKVAENILTFWFKPDKPVDYQPGQYTEIQLPHKNTDDRGDKRWFTLSSSPTEEMLSITTKFSSPGSSFKQTLLDLTPGTVLSLADPMGDFVLPIDPTIPLVFIVGGMGITPIRSMLKYLNDSHGKRNIELIYALHSKHELVFFNLLKSQVNNLIILTREDDGLSATLTANSILKMVGRPETKQFYLSGPELMIEKLVDQFEQTVVAKNQLVTDYFPGYDLI